MAATREGPQSTAGVGRLVAQLRHGGGADGVESVGHFTLDEAHARAKMQRFALGDPQRYVLELVQAAVLRGASSIAFEIDADDTIVEFDGEPFGAGELDGLFSSLFAAGDSRALQGRRKLAIAINAALGLDTRRVTVDSGGERRVFGPGGELEAGGRGSGEAAGGKTRVHVERRPSLAVLSDVVADRMGRLPIEALLRSRARYSAVPITLDGKPIAGPSLGTPGLAHVALESSDLCGTLMLTGGARARLILIKDGVWIETHFMRGTAPGLVGVVHVDALELDVSQARLVDDGRIPAIGRACAAQVWGVIEALHRRVMGGALGAAPVFRRAVLACVTLEALQLDARVRQLAGWIRWADAFEPEQSWSLAVLGARGELRYVQEGVSGVGPGPERVPRPLVVVEDAGELQELRRIFGERLESGGAELLRRRREQAGYRAWKVRPMGPRLPAAWGIRRARLRLSVDEPVRVRADLGLQFAPYSQGEPATVWWIHDGHCLAHERVHLGIENLWIAAEAEFTPRPAYEGVAPDGRLLGVLVEILCALGPLMGPLLAVNHERGVGRCREWLFACLTRRGRRRLLDALGFEEGQGEGAHFEEGLGQALGARMRLSEVGSSVHAIADVPLFASSAGTLSLRELRGHLASAGRLEYVAAGGGGARGRERPLLTLWVAELEVLRALLGADALHSHVDGQARRRAYEAHRQRPAHAPLEIAASLGAQGDLVAVGGASEAVGPRGVLWAAVDRRVEGPAGGRVEVLLSREGRTLGRAVVEAGCGPLRAAVEEPRLEGDPSWQSAAQNAAFEGVAAAVRAAARRWLETQVTRWASRARESNAALVAGSTEHEWLRRSLIHALGLAVSVRAGPGAAAPAGMEGLHLFWVAHARVDGPDLRALASARELWELIERDGRLAHAPFGAASRVSPRVLSTPGELGDVRAVFGARLVYLEDMGLAAEPEPERAVEVSTAAVWREEPEAAPTPPTAPPVDALAAALGDLCALVGRLAPELALALSAPIHVERGGERRPGAALVRRVEGQLYFDGGHPLFGQGEVGSLELVLALAASSTALALPARSQRILLEALAASAPAWFSAS